MTRIHLTAKRLLRWPGVWSDILLWSLILSLAGAGVWAWRRHMAPTQPKQRVTLVFKDANELARGSNVRMMGVEVGYVEDIQILADRVRVTLSPARGMPDIPDGSTATIQFTGLVGAKNVEITPPAGPVVALPPGAATRVRVQEPIRLRDAIAYNVQIANALKNGAQQFSDLFGRDEQVRALQRNIERGERAAALAAIRVENGERRLAQARQAYEDVRPDFARAHGNFVSASGDLARILSRENFVDTVHPSLDSLAAAFESATLRMERLAGVDRLYPSTQKHIRRAQKRLPLAQAERLSQGAPLRAEQLETATAAMAAKTEQAHDWLQSAPFPSADAILRSVRAFGRLMGEWAQTLTPKSQRSP